MISLGYLSLSLLSLASFGQASALPSSGVASANTNSKIGQKFVYDQNAKDTFPLIQCGANKYQGSDLRAQLSKANNLQLLQTVGSDKYWAYTFTVKNQPEVWVEFRETKSPKEPVLKNPVLVTDYKYQNAKYGPDKKPCDFPF